MATFFWAKIAIENGDFSGEIFGIIQLNFRLKIAFFSHLRDALARNLEEANAAAVLHEREGKRESAAPRRSERERGVQQSWPSQMWRGGDYRTPWERAMPQYKVRERERERERERARERGAPQYNLEKTLEK